MVRASVVGWAYFDRARTENGQVGKVKGTCKHHSDVGQIINLIGPLLFLV